MKWMGYFNKVLLKERLFRLIQNPLKRKKVNSKNLCYKRSFSLTPRNPRLLWVILIMHFSEFAKA